MVLPGGEVIDVALPGRASALGARHCSSRAMTSDFWAVVRFAMQPVFEHDPAVVGEGETARWGRFASWLTEGLG
jgi:hypothetical protein